MADNVAFKLAVLIDADNAQPHMASVLLAEIAKYGTAFVKRAYGDWTGTNLKGWKDQLLQNSILPMQQFAYTQGKNSTDAAMVIDAMDLLYSNRFDGFCLVSSDSDFTRLASRIRESGLVVYGFGERKAPKALVSACDKFVYIENLSRNVDFAPDLAVRTHKAAAAAAAAAAATPAVGFPTAQALIQEAIETQSDDDGWANLADVGKIITKWQPDFDARSFGFLKLSHMIRSDPTLEITARFPSLGKPAVVYVRARKRSR
ncbi:uncharacterized protein MAM_08398 [Metarhizium album ARSEF 1941]|uniref:HTH OST-type domain-containing protein n=1 Tax=Metarhizium album (strain ARSEF 1941) TaxID=1081103 RepID=A0A0B2WJY4_METAS|nr:uncharacterized protein MAM_08398 [Metarhizium album ARSEF 1941]KHN93757.1 hypothetical protein MAM_08398 [Metarhizium album ARSEF 1941]